MPAPGQGVGPFGMLFSALNAMQQQPQQGGNQPQQPPRPASAPPLSPEEAARRAAERRAAGLPSEAPGSTSSHLSPEAAAAQAGSSGQQPNPSTSGSSLGSGAYRTGPATFVWTTGGHRPPPASYPSSPRQEHRHLPGQSPLQQDSSHQQHESETHGPVRNLASFLQEAFTGGQQGSANTPSQQQHQGAGFAQTESQSAQQTGNAAQAGGPHGHQSDPLMHMLGGLANMFGLPIHGMTGGLQQQQQAHQQQQQTGSRTDQHGEHQEQGGNAQGTRTHTFSYGTPNQGTRIVFTFGGPPGDAATGPFPPAFLPFMMGMGGDGGMPGQMGDYVFSQGALDK